MNPLIHGAASAMLLIATSINAQELAAVSFLAGHWQEKTEREDTQEAWLGPQNDLMVAVNLSSRGARASFENLRIVKRDGKLIYLASPGGRSPPTEFPLKESDVNRVVFKNSGHDFPQRIIYRREGDVLIARIEGKISGQEKSKEWKFQRVRMP